MSINECEYKYHIESLQAALQHSPCGINILAITPRIIVLGEQDEHGAIKPATIGASSIAKKLDEVMTKYYDED